MKKKTFSLMILSSLFILGCNNSKEIKYYDVNALEEYIEKEGEVIPEVDAYSGDVNGNRKIIRINENEEIINFSFSPYVLDLKEKSIHFSCFRTIDNFQYNVNCYYIFSLDSNDKWKFENSNFTLFIYDSNYKCDYNPVLNKIARIYSFHNIVVDLKDNQVSEFSFDDAYIEDNSLYETDKKIFKELMICYFNNTIKYFISHNLDYNFINYC